MVAAKPAGSDVMQTTSFDQMPGRDTYLVPRDPAERTASTMTRDGSYESIPVSPARKPKRSDTSRPETAPKVPRTPRRAGKERTMARVSEDTAEYQSRSPRSPRSPRRTQPGSPSSSPKTEKRPHGSGDRPRVSFDPAATSSPSSSSHTPRSPRPSESPTSPRPPRKSLTLEEELNRTKDPNYRPNLRRNQSTATDLLAKKPRNSESDAARARQNLPPLLPLSGQSQSPRRATITGATAVVVGHKQRPPMAAEQPPKARKSGLRDCFGCFKRPAVGPR